MICPLHNPAEVAVSLLDDVLHKEFELLRNRGFSVSEAIEAVFGDDRVDELMKLALLPYVSVIHKESFASRYAQEWLRLHKLSEDKLLSRTAKVLRRIHRFVVRRAAQIGDLRPVDANRILPPGSADRWLRDSLNPVLLPMILSGAKLALKDINRRRSSVRARKDVERVGTLTGSEGILLEVPGDRLAAMQERMDEVFSMSYWGQINAASRERIRSLLDRSLQLGMGNVAIEREIRADTSGIFGRVRAQRIARTEATAALNGGHWMLNEQLIEDKEHTGIVGKEWLAILDIDVRSAHRAADGQQVKGNQLFTVGGERARFPGDPQLSAGNRINCVLPGTLVSGCFNVGYRAWYEGQAVEIELRDGRKLRVTEHHPVPTRGGVVAAGEVEVGDQLFCDERPIKTLADSLPGTSGDDYEPLPIEQVFEALSLLGFSEFRKWTSHDFNGDGHFINGNINIVGTDRKLLRDLVAGEPQQVGESILVVEDAELFFEDCERSFRLFLDGMSTSGCGLPGGATLFLDKFSTSFDSTPLVFFRVGSSARLYASFAQSQSDCMSSDVVAGGDGIDGLALEKSINDSLFRQGSTVLPDWNPVSGQEFPEGLHINAMSFCEFQHGVAGEICLNDVVSIRRFPYSGHVYDLQSSAGVILANGICICNCRCTLIDLTEDELKEEDANESAQQAIAGDPVDPSGFTREFVGFQHPQIICKSTICEQETTQRAARALRTHKPATADKQRHAENNEKVLAKKLKARSLDDNEPMDIILVDGETEHGIELKTMLDNTNDKITMHKESRLRKLDWQKEKPNRMLHTIVVDDRDAFMDGEFAEQYSGHKLYYKRGVGSFRLGRLEKMKSAARLRTKIISSKQ